MWASPIMHRGTGEALAAALRGWSAAVSAFRNAKRWCGSTLSWRCGASLKHLSGEWGQGFEFEEAEGTLIPQ
jgi:hypothetical protein